MNNKKQIQHETTYDADDLINEGNLKNEDDLKNEENPKNEDDLKIKII